MHAENVNISHFIHMLILYFKLLSWKVRPEPKQNISMMYIVHIFLPLILLQMCWGHTSRKWLQLPQLCPSIITIFQLSPVLTVSAVHDCGHIPFRNSDSAFLTVVKACWMAEWLWVGLLFLFLSGDERSVGRHWGAHPLLQRCEVQRQWPDGLWPVCQLQSASLVHPLRHGRGQLSLPLIFSVPSVLCLYCNMMFCDSDLHHRASLKHIFFHFWHSNCLELWLWEPTEQLAGQCVILYNAFTVSAWTCKSVFISLPTAHITI